MPGSWAAAVMSQIGKKHSATVRRQATMVTLTVIVSCGTVTIKSVTLYLLLLLSVGVVRGHVLF